MNKPVEALKRCLWSIAVCAFLLGASALAQTPRLELITAVSRELGFGRTGFEISASRTWSQPATTHPADVCLELGEWPVKTPRVLRGLAGASQQFPTVQRCRNFCGSTAAWLFLESSRSQGLGRPSIAWDSRETPWPTTPIIQRPKPFCEPSWKRSRNSRPGRDTRSTILWQRSLAERKCCSKGSPIPNVGKRC